MKRDLKPNAESTVSERVDAEFDYVIGRVTQHDVRAGKVVVVPAKTEVTAAHAAAALAAGVLEDLAFAVGMGDRSTTEAHGMPD